MFETGEGFNLFKGYSIYTWILVLFQVIIKFFLYFVSNIMLNTIWFQKHSWKDYDLKIFIHHTMVAYTKKRNLIKQCDYDNGVTEWQNNPDLWHDELLCNLMEERMVGKPTRDRRRL